MWWEIYTMKRVRFNPVNIAWGPNPSVIIRLWGSSTISTLSPSQVRRLSSFCVKLKSVKCNSILSVPDSVIISQLHLMFGGYLPGKPGEVKIFISLLAFNIEGPHTATIKKNVKNTNLYYHSFYLHNTGVKVALKALLRRPISRNRIYPLCKEVLIFRNAVLEFDLLSNCSISSEKGPNPSRTCNSQLANWIRS